MLPKNLRITDKFDFNKVKRFGKVIHSPLFILSYLIDGKNEKYPSRFGVIITNKIEKRSVKRHRAKRILIDLIYKNLDRFPGKGMYVFIGKPFITEKNYEEISFEFNQVLSKIPVFGSGDASRPSFSKFKH